MASLARIHFENPSILLSGVNMVFDATYASKKAGARILSALKCVSDLRTKQKIECSSSKANRHVKITSRFRHGGLRLVWFVLQSTCSSIYSPFFLARFGVREHWNEYVSVKRSACVCLCYSPDMFVCIPHVYYETRAVRVCVQRHGESFQSVYGLLGRFFVVLLTCHFAACHVYCRPKKPWNMKPIKWARTKLLTSCSAYADKFMGRLFW